MSIPAHICFAVLMGTWYGGAKKFEIAGEHERMKWASVLSGLVPAVAHGAFDFIATNTDKSGMVPVFVIYVIVMFVISWRLVRRLSENDAYMAQKAEGIDWNNYHQN